MGSRRTVAARCGVVLVIACSPALALPAGVSGAATARSLPRAPAICSLDVQITTLRDRTVVTWRQLEGASAYTIQRQNVGGAWLTVGTAPGQAASFVDRHSNPDRSRTYRVVTVGGGFVTCTSPSGITMNPKGDIGTPDFVVGPYSSGGTLVQQTADSATTPLDNVPSGRLGEPTYSPDGRWVAYTDDDQTAPHAVVRLRRADGVPRPQDATFSDPDGPLGSPAFSPNGRYLVMTTGSGLDYVDLFGDRAVHRTPQPAAGSGAPSWLPDNRTVVIPSSRFGTDLARQDVFTGASSTIANTENSMVVNVAPDGTIVYCTLDRALNEISPAGVITPLPSQGFLDNLRQLPDRSHLYFTKIVSYGPVQPTFFFASDLPRGQSSANDMAIGNTYEEVPFDVRAPRSYDTSDFTLDWRNDVLAEDSAGDLFAYAQSSVMSPSSPRRSLGGGWKMYRSIVAAGDLNSDGLADIVAQDPAGNVFFYAGTQAGLPAARVQLGSGTAGDLLVSVGDWDGDGHADLLSRKANGDLELLAGTGTGGAGSPGLRAPVVINHGWGSYTALLGVGDFNYDGSPDLAARDTAGRLWLYTSDGHGGLNPRRYLGAGWNTLTQLNAPGAFLGDTAVLGVSGSQLIWYGSVGDGAISTSAKRSLGTGWQGWTITS